MNGEFLMAPIQGTRDFLLHNSSVAICARTTIRLRDYPDDVVYWPGMLPVLETVEARVMPLHAKPWNQRRAEEPEIVQRLADCMGRLQNDVRSFAANCRESGSLNLDFLNKKFCDIQANSRFMLEAADTGGRIVFAGVVPWGIILEDMIETQLYIAPYLAGTANGWLKSRQCEQCGSIFFYERQRAKFCSNKCRMKAAYLKKDN